MKIQHIHGLAPLYTNTFLIITDAGHGILVDAAAAPQTYLDALKTQGAQLTHILLTHGHGYSVKSSLLPLRRRALELDVQLVLYGHTHLPALSEEEGVLFCNPGSCMGDRLYAEIELQDGKVADARLCQAEHRITRRMKPPWWKS